jgi:glucose/arabinose dehydrogenase
VAFGPAESVKLTETPGQAPSVAGFELPKGMAMTLYASGLSGPRDLEWVGDTLLVSEPSQGKVIALTDSDLDGRAEVKDLIVSLNKPHGLAYHKGWLFVAEETALNRYTMSPISLEIKFDRKLFDLPKGGRHTTRSIDIDIQGKIFVTIGSTCDVCEETDPYISTVLTSDLNGKDLKVFSRGLRNAVFVKARPGTDEVWVTEMGRDFLGDELPPDEVNVLSEGAYFGWPYCYGNKIWDEKFGKKDQTFCDTTKAPQFELPAHIAPLGLNFINSPLFPKDWQGDLLVAEHGSWNSTVPVGYKVVRLTIKDDKVVESSDFLTGFIQNGKVSSRPVDLEFGNKGELYISDDKGGNVFVMR